MQWGCRSGQLESATNTLTLDEEKTVWKQKKSGRCREGACRIEWELEEGNIKIGVLRCQIDPLVQRNRLEAKVMTAKLLDVERRGEVIAQIHHWDQLAKKLGPLIDAGGLRFVSRKAQAWISMPIPSPQAADPEYLRDQLAGSWRRWASRCARNPRRMLFAGAAGYSCLRIKKTSSAIWHVIQARPALAFAHSSGGHKPAANRAKSVSAPASAVHSPRIIAVPPAPVYVK